MSQQAEKAPVLEEVAISDKVADQVYAALYELVEERLYAAVEAAGFDMEEDIELETYDRLAVTSLVQQAVNSACTVSEHDLADWMSSSVDAFARLWSKQRA
jgi:hypothetical protein